MRRYLYIICVVLGMALLSSCSTKNDFDPSPERNLRELWRVLDEGYCYFDTKLPPDSSWHDYYLKYSAQVYPTMPSDSLFDLMAAMLAELKDGHVNLITPFDVSRYGGWKYDYPRNLNPNIRNRYLGTKYRQAGGLFYTTISYNDHATDSIGYVMCNSFSNAITSANILYVFHFLRHCKGLIVDIRDNGGGSLNNSTLLAKHFNEEKRLVGYSRYKAGPAHDHFAPRAPIYLETVKKEWRWTKPVIVLTNRGVYSAANDFARNMKVMPNALVLGDTTGGGAGLPRSNELPNGWSVRYSSSRFSDAEDRDTEFGIAPEVVCTQEESDSENGYDTLIEKAIAILTQHATRISD